MTGSSGPRRPDPLAALLLLLALTVVGYLVLPLLLEVSDFTIEITYAAVGVLAVLTATLGVLRHRPRRPRGWWLAIAGLGTWVLGDLVWTLEYTILGSEHYPGVSDVFYLGGYGFLAAGCLAMIRTRAGRDTTSLLDGLIVGVSVGMTLWVFAIEPLAVDTTLAPLARAVFTAYPLGDLMLLVVLLRLWTTPGASTLSFRMLVGCYALTFAADVVYSLPVGQTDGTVVALVLEAGWLGAYVLFAAAACVPSMLTLAETPPMREEVVVQRRSLAVLTLALTQPALVLLVTGAAGREIPWAIVAASSLALSGLVLARMGGLVEQVQAQSVQLAALARRDPLTGAPNRRSWEHELSRACAYSRDHGSDLCVAIIDLDHFKRYNDTHGHPVGDILLREAVAAWSEVVGDDGVLARYGGEEFTLLVEGRAPHEVAALVEQLQAVTPEGQTFSAGVARWRADTDPRCVVAQADQALYAAKRAGRNRVVVHDGSGTTDDDSCAAYVPEPSGR